MYEAFFGLKRRPFAATPDANCWFHSERYQAALDELLVCAEQGQGIGIVIAPAGAGKTLLCERLIRDIGEPFTSVLLRHATYQSRRGFLQTLLSELAQPFDKPSDQELRLALAPVLRGLGQQGRALLLVVDEAHTLSETLLEELRILADQAQDGKPLVRLVLCGQLALEDKLAHPLLQALNQRIRAHITVTPLSVRESTDYLDYRITWAGGRTEELFTSEAVDLICQAADGQPRCLNQLCDHALLLAYVAEQRPVTAAHIGNALHDLRHLPLAWNARPASTADQPSDSTSRFVESDSFEASSTWESSTPTENVVEWGTPAVEVRPEVLTPPAPRESLMPPPLPIAAATPPDEVDDDAWSEELIVDRYAALDAGLQPPPREQVTSRVDAAETIRPLSNDLFEQTAIGLFRSANSIDDRLDVLQHVLEYVSDSDEPRTSIQPPAPCLFEQRRFDDNAPEFSLGIDDDEAMFEDLEDSGDHSERMLADVHVTDEPAAFEPAALESSSFEPTMIEIGGPTATSPTLVNEPATVTTSRPLQNLFTLLRRKQQGRM